MPYDPTIPSRFPPHHERRGHLQPRPHHLFSVIFLKENLTIKLWYRFEEEYVISDAIDSQNILAKNIFSWIKSFKNNQSMKCLIIQEMSKIQT